MATYVFTAPAVPRGRVAVDGLFRKVNAPYLAPSVIVDEDGVREVHRPNNHLDPDTVFLAGSRYYLEDTDPRYVALVAAGYAMVPA